LIGAHLFFDTKIPPQREHCPDSSAEKYMESVKQLAIIVTVKPSIANSNHIYCTIFFPKLQVFHKKKSLFIKILNYLLHFSKNMLK